MKKIIKLKSNVSLVIGLIIIFIVLIFVFFPQRFTTYSPTAMDSDSILAAPGAEHIFGTDNFGRDVFARVVYGARIDIAIGVLAMLVPFVAGSGIGLIAGYFGGWIDAVLMRVLDIVMAFPFILLAIIIVAILGPGINNMYIAIWLVAWRDYARLVRSETLVVKNSEYIDAAKILGFSKTRIILGHVLPNVLGASLTFAASDIVMCIMEGATLSFLGLGAQPPSPEWGAMLYGGRNFLTQAWWMSAFPGLAICFTGIGFSMFGDGVSDLLRARSR